MDAVVAPGEIATYQSYIDTKSKQWTLNIWKCRFWHMQNQVLTVYFEKTDMKKNKFSKRYTVLRGEKWEDKPWGIKVETKEAGWLYGTIHSKAEWAGWLHAFIVLHHNLNPPVRRGSLDMKNRRLIIDTLSPDYKSSPETSPKELSPGAVSPERRVSFNGGVRVRTIPAIDDEDKSDLYYTDAELDKMKKTDASFLNTKRRMPVLA